MDTIGSERNECETQIIDSSVTSALSSRPYMHLQNIAELVAVICILSFIVHVNYVFLTDIHKCHILQVTFIFSHYLLCLQDSLGNIPLS